MRIFFSDRTRRYFYSSVIIVGIMSLYFFLNSDKSNNLDIPDTVSTKLPPKVDPIPEPEIKEDAVKVVKHIDMNASQASQYYLNECAVCHGNNGELSALNRSVALNSMSPKEITDALKGYYMTSYGGDMKWMMRQQIKHLSYSDYEQLGKIFINKKKEGDSK